MLISLVFRLCVVIFIVGVFGELWNMVIFIWVGFFENSIFFVFCISLKGLFVLLGILLVMMMLNFLFLNIIGFVILNKILLGLLLFVGVMLIVSGVWVG